MKPDVNSVGVHPQLSHNRLPPDGALVLIGATVHLSLHENQESLNRPNWFKSYATN